MRVLRPFLVLSALLLLSGSLAACQGCTGGGGTSGGSGGLCKAEVFKF